MCISSGANAQGIGWAGETWVVDRFDPEKFDPIGPDKGREDVLRILLGDEGFTANRPAGLSGPFYNTQGRKAEVNLPTGSFATVDLYVPQSWSAQQATDWQVTGLWGSTAKPTGLSSDTIIGFPIIAFSNGVQANGDSGASAPTGGRFQIFDDNTGVWSFLDDPVNYDSWNTMRIEILPDRYEFYLNGELVGVDTNIDADPDAFLKEVFLNSKVNQSSEYEAFYSRFFAGLLQQPDKYEIAGTVGAMSNVYHFNSLGDFVSRRGLSATDDFSLGKNVWVNTGGIRGDFDLSSGSSFDGEAYFARFGMDVIQPADGMRIGVTGSVGRAKTDMSTARGKADAESDNYSIGGYLTYVAPSFYLDILSEISWGDWDIRVPEESEQSTDATTFLVSAEAGAAIWRGDGFSLVPNAQLVYLNTDFDDVAFGYVDVSYEDSDAFIGRFGARFQYDVPDGVEGTRVYVGASVVSELAGDSETIIDSPTFSGGNAHVVSGGFDDVAAQFAAGVDLSLGASARLHGDASYLVGDGAEAFRGVGGLTFKW